MTASSSRGPNLTLDLMTYYIIDCSVDRTMLPRSPFQGGLEVPIPWHCSTRFLYQLPLIGDRLRTGCPQQTRSSMPVASSIQAAEILSGRKTSRTSPRKRDFKAKIAVVRVLTKNTGTWRISYSLTSLSFTHGHARL